MARRSTPLLAVLAVALASGVGAALAGGDGVHDGVTGPGRGIGHEGVGKGKGQGGGEHGRWGGPGGSPLEDRVFRGQQVDDRHSPDPDHATHSPGRGTAGGHADGHDAGQDSSHDGGHTDGHDAGAAHDSGAKGRGGHSARRPAGS